jgi:hypothetical protein
VDAVRAVPGVRAAAGWRALEWPYRGDVIGLSAYDAIYFRDRRFGEWPLHASSVPDPWDVVARGEGVVVSTSFVKSFGVGAGGTLELDTPTGPASLPIVGRHDRLRVAEGHDRARPRSLRAALARRDRHAHVRAEDRRRRRGGPPPRLAAALGTTFGVRILSARELMDYFVTQVRRAFS